MKTWKAKRTKWMFPLALTEVSSPGVYIHIPKRVTDRIILSSLTEYTKCLKVDAIRQELPSSGTRDALITSFKAYAGYRIPHHMQVNRKDLNVALVKTKLMEYVLWKRRWKKDHKVRQS